MAAITATVNLTTTPPRVDVALSGWSTSGAVTVQRVHADTTVHQIYMPDTSGGLSQSYDYWAPLGEPFTYQALDGSTLVTSGSVTIATDAPWLSAPGLADAAMAITPISVPSATAERPAAVMRGAFRETPAVEYGTLGSEEFSLDVRTKSAAERAALAAIVKQSGVLLLRLPLTEFTYRWVFVPKVPRSPVVGYRRESAADTTTVADWREWSLSCVTVSDPDPTPFGDPTASYQALDDSGKTYQQLLDWKGVGATTYLDVLRGGF